MVVFEAFPSGSIKLKTSDVEIKFFERIEPKDMSYEEIVEKTRDCISNCVEK